MPVARARRGARRVNKRNGETWDETVARIHAQFPSTNETRDWWYEQLESRRLRESILYDVLNIGMIDDQGGPTRRGSRPPLDYRKAMEQLRQLRGEDFTILPFAEAFQALAAGRSHRHLAAKTGLEKTQVYRLLNGLIAPTGEEMERVAAGFGKKGSYFREYRTAIICSLTARLLDDDPERSVVLVRKLIAVS